MERNLLLQKPRPISTTFFNLKEITISIIQGLIITIGLLLVYQYCIATNCTEKVTRTTIFLTLIVSNILLTLSNRSFYYSVLTTVRYKNNLVSLIIVVTLLLTLLLLFVPSFSAFFMFDTITFKQTILSVAIAFVSVMWIEIYKYFRRT